MEIVGVFDIVADKDDDSQYVRCALPIRTIIEYAFCSMDSSRLMEALAVNDEMMELTEPLFLCCRTLLKLDNVIAGSADTLILY